MLGRRPRNTLARIVVLVALCVLLRAFVFWPIRVIGPSMMPTYRDNQINFVNHLAYRWRQPQRGDVVAIRYTGPHMLLMKRVVGLPGETVAFVAGQLLIDGRPLEEPYVKFPCRWERAVETVGEDEYFVVGDNRAMHQDGHEFGRATRNRILGKVLL